MGECQSRGMGEGGGEEGKKQGEGRVERVEGGP